MKHLTLEELQAGLPHVAQSPRDQGRLELIVRRPATGEREVVQEGELSLAAGLIGDNWKARGSNKTPDGSAHPEKQITITNARMITLLAGESERLPLAGDQLFIDLDLGAQNLPPGTRLAIGGAVLEVTPPPHTGCKKFAERFGAEAVAFMSLPENKGRHLRGINTRVIQPGTIRVGDTVSKIQSGKDSGPVGL